MKFIIPMRVVISLILFVFSTSLFATPATPKHQKSGFRALNGQAVVNFQLPTDVILSHSAQVGKNGSTTALRYQQHFAAAEVLGGQLTVYKDADGSVITVIGAHYPNLLTSNEIKLNSAMAHSAAKSKIGGAGQWKSKLMINPSNGRFFYRVENVRPDSRWIHWIDAEDGTIVNAYDGLTTGSGIGVLGDTKDLTDLTRFNNKKGQFEMISVDGRQTTNDAKNRNKLPGSLATDSDDTWDTPGTKSPGHPALVDAHFYAKVTDNYFLNNHGFNWLDHYTQGMVSSAHLKRNYNNAYWNGSQMAYGDGDGVTFRELSGDLDVVGHELTHGVTEATSKLIYQNESGALNEAFSDIMGTNIEFANGSGNWTIGEDITIGSNGIRNMQDPNEDGDPSHYDDRYTGSGDNGGVHTNSGIANHWYYLLVNGGQNANGAHASGTDVKALGLSAAEQVAFLGFTALPATATFCNARTSTIAVGATEFDSDVIADAWDEVGVTDALCTTGTGDSGSGGTGAAPVISDVSSKKLNGVKFKISWTTDIPADSQVTFSCCGTYTKTGLVTDHAFNFNGSRGYEYEYYVSSTDANGLTSTDGPYYHQN